ncbi:DoxX family protein [Cytophaga sp. FL35]|uniref:DoxX family protein n=1 Tax=Cytophaga sp. FL35 TaxID=1904456 RepID=UPI0016535A6D|nr:DoxX family protein [Cytophaga sp. FL35]MBC6997097.1 DoxX family protein [Cytophaga sp. FL35]
MEYLFIVIKAFIFISIVNVWIFRFNKPTPYRGGAASSMKEEFANYGLSIPILYIVGGLKLLAASLIFLSIWIPYLVLYGAVPMVILMLGAIAMHVKIKDELKKSIPAITFLILSIILIIKQ